MASLTVLRGDEEGAAIQLDAAETVVGRDEGCGIQLDGLGLSRRHCTIVKQGDRFLVRDLESENGTWVNGERIQERELQHGDRIGLGLQASLRFQDESQRASPAGERPAVPTAAPVIDELEEERPVNRWLLAVVLIAVLALIAFLAQFSLGG